MSDECPCDECVTRAMCLLKPYRETIGCPLVREYLNADSGSITIPELKVFCDSMNLLLIERHTSSIGTTAYFVSGKHGTAKIGDRL